MIRSQIEKSSSTTTAKNSKNASPNSGRRRPDQRRRSHRSRNEKKKARVEDALHACRAAVEEGILPGGGVAVFRTQSTRRRTQESKSDERIIDIVDRAVNAPIKQIAANFASTASIIASKVEENTHHQPSASALTHEYGDLVQMGVIVPTKVERVALQNAASISGLLLTTDAAVVELKDKKAKAPAGGMDDMDY